MLKRWRSFSQRTNRAIWLSSASQISITDKLPPELLTLIVSWLEPSHVCAVMQTSHLFRTICQQEDLWKRFCIVYKHLSFKMPVQTWRQLYSSDTDHVCVHLSDIRLDDDLALRWQQIYQNNSICCDDCALTLPDLWLCLTPGCGHLGCGRRRHGHGLRHHESCHGHNVVIKPKVLMFWCYECKKFLGGPAESALEKYRLMEIMEFLSKDQTRLSQFWTIRQRRYEERRIARLRFNEKLFIVATSFLINWQDFLMGDVELPPPSPRAAQQNLADRIRDMNMDLLINIDFSVVGESTWKYISSTYNIEPELSENVDIVFDHFTILSQIARNH